MARDKCRHCGGGHVDLVMHEENCVMRDVETKVIGYRPARYPGEPLNKREIVKRIKPIHWGKGHENG